MVVFEFCTLVVSAVLIIGKHKLGRYVIELRYSDYRIIYNKTIPEYQLSIFTTFYQLTFFFDLTCEVQTGQLSKIVDIFLLCVGTDS